MAALQFKTPDAARQIATEALQGAVEVEATLHHLVGKVGEKTVQALRGKVEPWRLEELSAIIDLHLDMLSHKAE